MKEHAYGRALTWDAGTFRSSISQLIQSTDLRNVLSVLYLLKVVSMKEHCVLSMLFSVFLDIIVWFLVLVVNVLHCIY